MAVAWIGSREVTGTEAARRAAELLAQSRCPVFSLDGDVHAWRAAIALAERVGASYDQLQGATLARELALFTGKGAITVAPGEVRRRADCIVLVGEIPASCRVWLKDVSGTKPDLAGGTGRSLFRVDSGRGAGRQVSSGGGIAQTLAALRAQLAGRSSSATVSNFDALRKALGNARYAAFLYSGAGLDELAIEMLQGIVADLNRTQRAAMLLLPDNEDAWGGALASTWMTGFAPRTGFGRGMPEYDPWRFDAARMIADREADLHLVMASRRNDIARLPRRPTAIVLSRTDAPVANAAVTIAIGEPGRDHDAVRYSHRTGTIVAQAAEKPSQRASAAAIIGAISEALPC
ncbi:MAG: tungsten formylmethanofuran dehydrogenase [Rhizobiaceae bacterium]|nr:tungsten formylmethanofuran dehydrogenase [Rhizobiaceae bacterium]